MTRLAGRYELVKRLAEGGMAEVWLGVAHGDFGFTRRVAIKQLFASDADGGGFERMFLDEARITSRLHHAGIVGILDFGVEAGRPFQVLELVDGFDAARLSSWGREQQRPLPVGLALQICAWVGHALHFAHVAVDDEGAPLNIVHRDVSPQNVLLSRGGDVKLSDFGIAFAEGRLERTVGGVARGKPAYMAPEQAVRGAMDGRTDVFGLGCVLHALVTGQSALRDENALVDLLAGQELTLDPALPAPVQALVARATRRNKAERYETAEEMALACAALVPQFLSGDPRAELAAWVQSVSPAATRDAPTPRPVVPVQRAPGRRSRQALLGGLLVVGAGAAILATRGAPEVVALTPEVVRDERPAEPLAPETRTSDAQPGERTQLAVLTPAPPLDAGPREAVMLAVAAPDAGPVRTRTLTEGKPRVLGTGILSVGGEALLRGEVFIDGVSRGFAPGRFELSAGAHHVEVQAKGGQLLSREVTITRQHTPAAPLSWEQ